MPATDFLGFEAIGSNGRRLITHWLRDRFASQDTLLCTPFNAMPLKEFLCNRPV